MPAAIARQKLEGQWEAYQIRTDRRRRVAGRRQFRGTAFAAYTLSERLGIDPLYLWTGYTPEKQPTLVLKQTDFLADPPTFKYRGFFHDDEDILPRPFDENGYPLQTGTVPRCGTNGSSKRRCACGSTWSRPTCACSGPTRSRRWRATGA